ADPCAAAGTTTAALDGKRTVAAVPAAGAAPKDTTGGAAGSKPWPDSVTRAPPSCEPWVGDSATLAGKPVKRNAPARLAPRPSGLVTTTLAAPGACGGRTTLRRVASWTVTFSAGT